MSAAYDAIVVGAGPAGSTAARHLARAGARVLLLDRAKFPRDKPCGGGITFRADDEVDVDLSPVTEREIYGVRVSIKLGRRFDRAGTTLLARMTQRSRLDEYLAVQAACAGAEFRDAVRVSAIELDGTMAIVRSQGDTHVAPVLVGADGVNGVTAPALGLRAVGETAVAIEANYPLDEVLTRHWDRFMGIDLAGIPGGFGWIFPKEGHLNVGVGGWRYAAPALRDHLSALCTYHGLDDGRLFNHRGYQLPLRREGASVVRGPAMLAGDAAGLVDPLSGEGIWAAFVSGRVAAREALDYLSGDVCDLRGYQAALDNEVRSDIRGSRRLQGVLERLPSLSVLTLKYSDTCWRYVTEIMRGELTYPNLSRKLGPLGHLVDLWGDLETRLHERNTRSRVGGR